MNDTEELRRSLARSWQSALDRSVDLGFPMRAVLESMVSVAHERFSEMYGPNAAANYLQLLAANLRDLDIQESKSLVSGASCANVSSDQSFDLFEMWEKQEDLLS